MENLIGIQFIGDLSLEDANLLVKYGKASKSILEFGVGGSTQILAQCFPDELLCVETDRNWMQATINKLALIEHKTEPSFQDYDAPITGVYDFIFVDGVDHLRLPFAKNTWDRLKVGGVMVFHDTRREQDFANVMQLARGYFNEIECIEVNQKASNGKSSNMTVIKKKQYEPYVNWNQAEGKPQWAYGTKDNVTELWQYRK